MTIALLAFLCALQTVPAAPSAHARALTSAPRRVAPVLAFPEPGLDDTAAYQGYETRLYRDSRSNTVQIYLDRRSGRVVQLWADALDESVGFTVRTTQARPAPIDWAGDSATVSDSGRTRTIAYRLRAAVPAVTLGWFLLGTMRVERDFQYARAHLRPFGGASYVIPSESTLVANVARLSGAEQRAHVSLLGASSVAELRARLTITPVAVRSDSVWIVRVEHTALDGRSHLRLELIGDPHESTANVAGRTVSIRARSGRVVHLTVRVSTDGDALTPLTRAEIFNPAFLDFLARARAADDSASDRENGSPARGAGRAASPAALRDRRIEREVRSVELLSSREKLMAGLPNFATYFGRDGLMTALMMRPIWTPTMSERVIASVLGKLGPHGDVSHEEALGEQAIREHAGEYDADMATYFERTRGGDRALADSALADSALDAAREVLRHLRRTRENYHMMDDEFQLPVLEARYLADSTVSADRKRAFLADSAVVADSAVGGDPRGGVGDDVGGGASAGSAAGNDAASGAVRAESHLALMLREMALVSMETRPFADHPTATDLVGFVKSDSTHWRSASWRDSDVGYANGRFAMDINAIWAPRALRSIAGILASLRALGYTAAALDSAAPEVARSPLGAWITDSTTLRSAIDRWHRSRALFRVVLDTARIAARVRAKVAWLPRAERRYWTRVMREAHEPRDSLVFLALALDSAGSPIPVENTDPATDLFLEDFTARIVNRTATPAEVLEEVQPFVRDYPVGLFVPGLGPLVANDAYASRSVWDEFRREPYHGPRVVWGREVNLFLLGVTGQIAAAYDPSGRLADPALAPYVRSLRDALRRVLAAVSASGLQHNELWSYRISNGRLLPTRYGTSSDVQLWSSTDLAVQFALSHLPPP